MTAISGKNLSRANIRDPLNFYKLLKLARIKLFTPFIVLLYYVKNIAPCNELRYVFTLFYWKKFLHSSSCFSLLLNMGIRENVTEFIKA